MSLIFVYNNLKVNPFILSDNTPPGFEVLTWDNESWAFGSLWDIGVDAGYTEIGNTQVKGQLWITKDKDRITDIEKYFGVKKGITEPVKIKVEVTTNDKIVTEVVSAVTYRLTEIKPDFKLIRDGHWIHKRINYDTNNRSH